MEFTFNCARIPFEVIRQCLDFFDFNFQLQSFGVLSFQRKVFSWLANEGVRLLWKCEPRLENQFLSELLPTKASVKFGFIPQTISFGKCPGLGSIEKSAVFMTVVNLFVYCQNYFKTHCRWFLMTCADFQITEPPLFGICDAQASISFRHRYYILPPKKIHWCVLGKSKFNGCCE